MKVGELGKWNSSKAAMGSDLVVILFPDRGRIPSLLQCLKPTLIKVFIPKLHVETLDIAVLHRATLLNQDMTIAMCLYQCHVHPACELRAFVGSHHFWIAPEHGFSV